MASNAENASIWWRHHGAGEMVSCHAGTIISQDELQNSIWVGIEENPASLSDWYRYVHSFYCTVYIVIGVMCMQLSAWPGANQRKHQSSAQMYWGTSDYRNVSYRNIP